MNAREVTVRIAPVGGRPGAYVARYRAEVLEATYSVEFEDNVMGGIALHGFAEMLRLKWGLRRVELVIDDQALRFRSKAVVDALLAGSVETTPPVASLARRGIRRLPEGPRAGASCPGGLGPECAWHGAIADLLARGVGSKTAHRYRTEGRHQQGNCTAEMPCGEEA